MATAVLNWLISPGGRGTAQEGLEQIAKPFMRAGSEHAAAKVNWSSVPLWKKPFKGAGAGLKFAYKGAGPMIIGMAALQAGMAPRGHKASTFTTSLIAQVPGAIIGGAVGSLIGMPGLGAIVGGMVIDPIASKLIGKPLQMATEFARGQARLEMGGNYQDSQQALTMRQVASREMSQSMLNARHWLGSEGSFMHQ